MHGEIESAGNGLGGLAAGDGSVSLAGTDPIGFVHLDENPAFSAGAGLARPVPPGADQVVRRCGADDDAGAADTGMMSPAGGAPDLPAAAAGTPEPEPVGEPEPAGEPEPGQGTTGEPAVPGPAADVAEDSTAPGEMSKEPMAAAGHTAGEPAAESLPPVIGPAHWGVVVGVLGGVAAAMIVPAVVAFAVQNRRGRKWVRSNVQAVVKAAPAVGIPMTPEMDWPGLPTFGVRLALRADSGTQAVTEVEQ